MFAPYLFELIVLAAWLAVPFAVYWLIRLAVRHGVMDAHRRLPGHLDHAADQSASGAAPTAPRAD